MTAIGLVLASGLSPALARDDADSEAAAEGGPVEDITVTARYRTESVQQVPIAITTLAADRLASQGATNIRQVLQQLPSLNIQGFGGRNQTITIRGIGTNAGLTNDGLEQGVGIYIDGVYRARTGTVITDLPDLESIQLLRGPQGTLFGKNTVAGALDIKTREPSFDPQARGEITYGNYNQFRGAISGEGAINDRLSVRLSYAFSRRDGLIYNTTFRQDWDNQVNHSVRLDLLFKPTDSFKLRVIADYSILKGNMGFQSVAAALPTTLGDGTRVRGYYGHAADVGYVPIPINPFARQVDINSSQYDKMPSWGVQARADWDVGPATLTSITAYRNWKWIPNFDGDQIGADVVPVAIVDTKQQQFSQELRIASSGQRTIDYTGGLYFFWQEANDRQVQRYGPDAAAWLLTPNAIDKPISAIPSAALNGLVADAHVVPATYSYAAYGQATWNISPVFRLTGGLRLTYEHKTGLFDSTVGGNIAPLSSFAPALQPFVAGVRNSFAPVASYKTSSNTTNLSWNLVASYDIDPSVHAYASYSRGYKSPGINLIAPKKGIDIFVRPEKVDNFEVGLKSRLLNGSAEVNVALFWTDVSNYQANFVNNNVTPSVTYITNVGNLRSRGVELDARATPISGLTLGLAGTYNDAKYRSYPNAPAPYTTSYLGVVDLSGQQAAGAPKWALTGNTEYVYRTGSAEIFVGGDVSYRSQFLASVNLDPASKVPGYAVVGLHGGVRAPDGRWDVSLWVRNLFDKDYYNTLSVSNQFGIVIAGLGDPRLFGVTLKGRL